MFSALASNSAKAVLGVQANSDWPWIEVVIGPYSVA